MSSNISIQSGHLSSPQQQTVTQIQLQQQQQQQQQQQDPTKSVQWQITTSSAASQQHNINNKVGGWDCKQIEIGDWDKYFSRDLPFFVSGQF